jgi:hypothetical protein
MEVLASRAAGDKREGERVLGDGSDARRVDREAELRIALSVGGGELVGEEIDDVGAVDELEGEDEGEELETGRVGGIDGEGDPVGGDAAAESKGGLLGVGHGRGGLEKIRVLDGGKDVEVGERGEDKDANDALYR